MVWFLALSGCVRMGAGLHARPAARLDEVALVAAIEGETYLIGDAYATAWGEWTHVGVGPDTWIAPTADVDPSRPVGSEWRIGAARCTVAGYAAVVEEYAEYFDEGGERQDNPTEPGCGAPTIWSRVVCDQAADSDVAVPWGGVPPAEVVADLENDVAWSMRVSKVLGELPSWNQAHADASAQAATDSTVVSESIDIKAYAINRREWAVVDARVWSGDGANYCGGGDFFSRVVLLLADRVQGPVLDLSRDDEAEITDVSDVDGDGVPEITLAFWGDTTIFNAAGESKVLRHQSICVCGC